MARAIRQSQAFMNERKRHALDKQEEIERWLKLQLAAQGAGVFSKVAAQASKRAFYVGVPAPSRADAPPSPAAARDLSAALTTVEAQARTSRKTQSVYMPVPVVSNVVPHPLRVDEDDADSLARPLDLLGISAIVEQHGTQHTNLRHLEDSHVAPDFIQYRLSREMLRATEAEEVSGLSILAVKAEGDWLEYKLADGRSLFFNRTKREAHWSKAKEEIDGVAVRVRAHTVIAGDRRYARKNALLLEGPHIEEVRRQIAERQPAPQIWPPGSQSSREDIHRTNAGAELEVRPIATRYCHSVCPLC